MPNSNNDQRNSSTLKNIATFGFGALVGAIAAGAAYYFSSEEENHQRQGHQYSSNHPVNRSGETRRDDADDEKDEKDGAVKVCEICFASFEELKECSVQIVSTPCGHVYCRDCIIGALAVKPECPHCRSEVREGQLRRLYL